MTSYETIKFGQKLLMELQKIGRVIDSGNKASATQLLSNFNKQIKVFSGGIISATAASQILSSTDNICVDLNGTVCP